MEFAHAKKHARYAFNILVAFGNGWIFDQPPDVSSYTVFEQLQGMAQVQK